MFETATAKSASWLAAMSAVANPDAIKSVLRFDPETVCGIILLYIFIFAPATMGREYDDIMGKVVENAWPLALAYIAPLSGRMGERLAGALEKVRARNGEGKTV